MSPGGRRVQGGLTEPKITGPYRHDDVPDLGDAQAALRVEHYRIGPPMEQDWTRWETELAYLVVED